MVSRRKDKKGFTLVELLIVMFASSIIMGVMVNIFMESWKVQMNQEARNNIQQKSRQSVDEITAAIRQAIAVVDTIAFDGVTYYSDGDSVILKYSALDANNNILPQTDYIVFMTHPTETNRLQKLVFADPASTRASLPESGNLNTELGELIFSYYNASGGVLSLGSSLETTESIKVSVSTNRTVNGQTLTSVFEDSTHLRNNILVSPITVP